VIPKPWREGVRALVLDTSDRVLLVHFSFPPYPWATPGGGIEDGESDEHALRRELAEEIGLDDFDLGPLLWQREHEFDLGVSFRGQRERCYLVRVAPFEPAPRLDLAAEGVDAVRWWTPGEIQVSTEVFAPRRLSAVLAQILAHGPPAEPLVLGK
jgi:8-oxo-dGTP pyrophosphatase MutT (NUDIX family)